MNRIWLLLLCFGCGCSSTAFKSVRDQRPGPFIAVMAAYPPEIEANESVLTEGATRVATWRIDGIVFQQVRFEGHDLLLFPSGVSMVNAAMNTQKALDRFRISHVFFAGIAGGINPERHIGDVVIPEPTSTRARMATATSCRIISNPNTKISASCSRTPWKSSETAWTNPFQWKPSRPTPNS